jgi:predicted secreted protein
VKLLSMLTAGAVALAGLAPVTIAPAAAQGRTVVTERTVIRHDERRGYHHRDRTVCDWKWRNHHRVKVCRTFRR